MKSQVGISGQMFSILGKNGINIKAIAQGSSERNITVVIQKKYLKKAINVLHESFFVNEIKQVKLFIIGLGNVGKAFLNQIALQKTYLFKEFNLEFQIIGVANSRKMLFNEDGLDPLEVINIIASGDVFEQSEFIYKMRQLNLRNSIFIDITASAVVAEAYEEILKETISVVTPNKIAATRSFANYQALKSTANKFKSHFELYGICNHSGGAGFGHYYSYCKYKNGMNI